MDRKSATLGVIAALAGVAGCAPYRAVANRGDLTDLVNRRTVELIEDTREGGIPWEECVRLYEDSLGWKRGTTTDEELEMSKDVEPEIYRKSPKKCHNFTELFILTRLKELHWSLEAISAMGYLAKDDNWSMENTRRILKHLKYMERKIGIRGSIEFMEGVELKDLPEFVEDQDNLPREEACQVFRRNYSESLSRFERRLSGILSDYEERVPQLETSKAYQKLKRMVVGRVADLMDEGLALYECPQEAS